jgi:hypothetical protein
MPESKVRYLYFYTFMFSPVDLLSITQNGQDNRFINNLKESLTKDNIDIMDSKFIRVVKPIFNEPPFFHIGEEDEPWELRPSLFMRFPHLHVSARLSPNPINRELKLLVQNADSESIILSYSEDFFIGYRIVFFSNGIGAFIISLDINENGYKKFDNIDDLNLISTIEEHDRNNASARLLIADSYWCIHQLFNDTISSLWMSLKTTIEEANLENNYKWLDLEVIARETSDIGQGHFQLPFTLMILPINDISPEQRLKLLFNYENLNFVDESFVKRYIDYHSINNSLSVANMFPSNRFFMHIYTDKAIALYSGSINDAQFQIEGLIRTIGLSRAGYHLYMITNARLSNIIKEYNDRVHQNNFNLNQLEFLKKELFDLRSQIVRGLEDPSFYTAGHGDFERFYSKSLELFRIETLKENIFLKIDELDKIIETIDKITKDKIEYKEGMRSIKTVLALIVITGLIAGSYMAFNKITTSKISMPQWFFPVLIAFFIVIFFLLPHGKVWGKLSIRRRRGHD